MVLSREFYGLRLLQGGISKEDTVVIFWRLLGQAVSGAMQASMACKVMSTDWNSGGWLVCLCGCWAGPWIWLHEMLVEIRGHPRLQLLKAANHFKARCAPLAKVQLVRVTDQRVKQIDCVQKLSKSHKYFWICDTSQAIKFHARCKGTLKSCLGYTHSEYWGANEG